MWLLQGVKGLFSQKAFYFFVKDEETGVSAEIGRPTPPITTVG
jgi:hypothetical protein